MQRTSLHGSMTMSLLDRLTPWRCRHRQDPPIPPSFSVDPLMVPNPPLTVSNLTRRVANMSRSHTTSIDRLIPPLRSLDAPVDAPLGMAPLA